MVEIKGSVVLDSIDGIKRRGEEAFAEVVAQLDDETKAMIQGTVSSSSWYSLDLFLRFLAVELEKSAHGNEQVLVTRSKS